MRAVLLVGATFGAGALLVAVPAQQAFGLSTPDAANGNPPAIELPVGPIVQGQTFTVTFRGTRSAAQSALLVVSSRPAVPQPLAGAALHVDIGPSSNPIVLPLTLPAVGTGLASLAVAVQLPPLPFFLQLFVDTGGGWAASSGHELPILASPPAGNPFNQTSALGTNLAGVVDWSTQSPFVDVFRSSREWVSGDANTWDNGWTLDLDSNGNLLSLLPNQIARTILFQDFPGSHAGGRHLCLYEGAGAIQYGAGGSLVAGLSSPGRHVVDVQPDGIVLLYLTAVDPANPIRNLHFVPEGAEATYSTQVFAPQFLQRTRKFATLRFMDWQHTNNSALALWADRARPEHLRWSTARGVPVEIMVELCNQLDADAWFCMPHLADDTFVTQFATYVRDHLEPGRKCCIEHSNEVWNGQFGQAAYAQQRGLQLGLSTNAYEAQLRYHSLRSVQIFQIFTNVFGGTARLVRVLASQHASPWTGTQVADFQNAFQQADALATAPYFGPIVQPATLAQFLSMSVDQLLDHIQNTEIPAEVAAMQQNSQNAATRGLAHITYEGGQHLVGIWGLENNQQLTDLLIAANRHPRMAQLYQQHLTNWRVAGGRSFVHFSDIGAPSKWGSWGALEFRDQDIGRAPKHAALQSFLLTNPRWW